MKWLGEDATPYFNVSELNHNHVSFVSGMLPTRRYFLSTNVSYWTSKDVLSIISKKEVEPGFYRH